MEFNRKKLLSKKTVFNLFGNIRSAALITGPILLAMTTPGHSQTVVTLQSADENISITGELISADEQNYTIETSLGLLTILRDSVECLGDGCPSVEPEAPVVETSREVVLHSVGDETRISGELVDVEEKHYVIRNSLGEFRVTIASVTCEGDACPVIDTYSPEVTIFAASSKVNTMLADLLRGYADSTDQVFEIDVVDDATQTVRIIASNSGELVANVNLSVKNPEDAASALSGKSADVLVYGQEQIGGQFVATGGVLQNALAFDGQVIVSHSDNPVRDLSLVEIEQIWNGELTSWRTLGGGDFPIAVHMLQDSADTNGWLTGLRASSTPGVITHNTEEEVIAAIKADRNAVGVVHSAPASLEHANMLAVRKTCGLTSDPSNFGIRTQHYPFTQPINAYAQRAGMHPFAQSFLEWTQSGEAASNISKFGYTTTQLERARIQDFGVAVVHAAAVEPDFSGIEFTSMMQELRAADRLSMTFTFITGSTVLDEVSLLTIKDLARRLRGSEFANQEILLVGFADNTGPADRNTELSVRRALTVREVLAQEFDTDTLARLNLTEMGFGEQMPVDCNTTDTGRANNRRVEVWARVQN